MKRDIDRGISLGLGTWISVSGVDFGESAPALYLIFHICKGQLQPHGFP
jgi:hypothetical protein